MWHLFQPPFSVPLCIAGSAHLKTTFPRLPWQLSNFSSTNQIQSRETNSDPPLSRERGMVGSFCFVGAAYHRSGVSLKPVVPAAFLNPQITSRVKIPELDASRAACWFAHTTSSWRMAALAVNRTKLALGRGPKPCFLFSCIQ